MDTMPLSAADVSAVTRGNDGMFGGEWAWILIILFALWGNNGWGNNNRDNLATTDYVASEFTQRDIFNTNQNVSDVGTRLGDRICDTRYDLGTSILENRYTNQLGLQNLGSQMQNCCCETNRNIDSVRYDNLLTAKDAQAQLASCCCDLKAQGIENTQKILDKLCENEVNALRTELQSAQLQISQLSQTANIVNSIIPRPAPAYPSCSPFVPSNYGFNNFGCGCNSCGC